MTMQVFDATPCFLGEGPLWHPERQSLFWFDIINARLFERGAAQRDWQFAEPVSAAGWIDRTRLMIASASALLLFDVESGAREMVLPLEAGRPGNRSNDGRADPQGGFWIGTMGRGAEPGAGAIWRYWRGELRQILPGLTIPNSITFTPDGTGAYFADSAAGMIWTIGLDAEGWPVGERAVFLDASGEDWAPDGSVTDREGCIWNAQWGASRVARYTPEGRLDRVVSAPAPHTSCPAFGGDDLQTLFVTTAQEGMDDDARAAHPDAGQTFFAETDVAGRPEYQVIL